MPKVHKTITQAANNLSAATATMGQRYKDAVAKADWEGPTASQQTEENWQAGIQEAIANGSRIAGVQKAGNEKYRKNAADKGGAVIGSRVKAAVGTYQQNFAPVLQAMTNAADSAPARTRDAMTNIQNRLVPVVQAAIAAKGK